jgi:thiol-disulfide isomerase/thioredoxin
MKFLLAGVWLIGTLSCAAALQAEPPAFPVKPGDRAPNFNLDVISPTAQKGATVRLYDLVGDGAKQPARLVLVSFFATWCEPCKAELPVLQRLHERHGPEGLRVVVLVVEGAEDQAASDLASKVSAYAAAHRLTLPFLLDPNMKDVVAMRYIGPSRALPATFLVGPDGRVIDVMTGLRDDLEAVVTRLVSKR